MSEKESHQSKYLLLVHNSKETVMACV